MTEQPTPDVEAAQPVRDRLQELAGRLREAHHLTPEARGELAELVGELAAALDPAVSQALAAHLAQTSEHLTRVLDEGRHAGPLASARRQLEALAVQAETKAPVISGVVRRLIDVLAGIGA
jgi:hypothetical protein